MNYYNENDPHAAQWLRNLISEGLIPDGWVDDRSIEDVRPEELERFNQCHFFAGIGGWPLALALAGVDSAARVWTGSCPCQPFSTAGKRKGLADDRHVWPAFRWLLSVCRPPVVFGEQVASPDGRTWLAGVQADLEVMGYGTAAADLCAAGVGAPHIRQRLYWVAESYGQRLEGQRLQLRAGGPLEGLPEAAGGSEGGRGATGGRLSDAESGRRKQGAGPHREHLGEGNGPANGCWLGDSCCTRTGGQCATIPGAQAESAREWLDPWNLADCSLTAGADGKYRRIKSGLEPLADGVPGRVGLLRGYGNAIVPQVAATFIQAYTET